MSTLTTIQSTDLITNSRANINDNFSALNTDKIETSYLDTDTTLAANSDSKIPTQKAVKAYVDAGGNVNASETNKGIVEEATDAEVTAGTATGATGAKLFVTPAKLATRISGLTIPVVRTYVLSGSPHTWTKPSELKYIVVEGVGGGSGGQANSAGGGAGGGYSKKLIAASSLGATETVTIGAGGDGGVDGGANATSGGTTTFGSHITCNGGTAPSTSADGGQGGTSSGGDINISGQHGSVGRTDAVAGAGGSSMLGLGGVQWDDNDTTGKAGSGYGSGGSSGQDNGGATSGCHGAAGNPGVVILTEYYV